MIMMIIIIMMMVLVMMVMMMMRIIMITIMMINFLFFNRVLKPGGKFLFVVSLALACIPTFACGWRKVSWKSLITATKQIQMLIDQ